MASRKTTSNKNQSAAKNQTAAARSKRGTRKRATQKATAKVAESEVLDEPRVLTDIPEGITVRPGETILESALSDELSFSFMDYAMAVIVSRALPDAADGLKPVQRRILWAMYKSGSRPGGKFSKSAGHVGETMGKYHPHGDAAIYATMVRMAQDFNNNIVFVEGQGNFGSLDDGPAAQRYTEARLAPAAMAALADIDEDVVDFQPNYDGTREEPKVLPMRIPALLVNGATGIAVGMATNIAPHNLKEVAEAAKLLLWNPKATPDDLRQHILGPDFPSGGTILGGEGLDEAYRTGKGNITIRGRARVATEGRSTQLVIDELPYQIGPEKFITAVVEEVEKGRLDGIRDISDHSDRNTGLRIVIDLKAGVDPEAVLALLYKHTPLEQRFSIQHVALVDGEPRLLNLAEMLSVWVEHQLRVVVRRTQHRLNKAKERLHIVEGLIKALDQIDLVVSTIKRSQNVDTAKKNLKKAVGVDDTQAGYIVDMPLRRLTSLETKKLREEAKELAADIRKLQKILKSDKEQRQLVADELDAWVGELGWERRSRVVSKWETLEVPTSVEAEDEPCVVTISRSGLVGRDEGGRRQPSYDDVLVAELAGTTRGMIYLCDQTGQAHRVPGYVIPSASGRNRGVRPSQFLSLNPGARLVGGWTDADLEAGRIPAVITRGGVVKTVNPDTLATRSETQQIINLEGGDEIVWVGAVARDDELWFITRQAQVLRTPAAPIRPQGRNAGGVAGIKLADGDEVIAGGATAPDMLGSAVVVVATDGGRVKASPAAEYPPKGRATGGVRTIRFLKGEDHLTAAALADKDRWVVAAGRTVCDLDRDAYAGKRDSSGTPADADGAIDGAGNLRG